MNTPAVPLHKKFLELEDQLNEEILERPHEIHTAVLALASRKHHFQVGPPGAAKSLLVERLAERIDGLGDEGYFRWLLTRYTTPEELFGGPDFQQLTDHGIYKRVTERKFPRAKIAFLDETFKGNSSILNSLLTAMNERLFFNHDDDPNIPLVSIFGASNELASGDELAAMWDRLHFRHHISAIQETSSFMRMIAEPIDTTVKPEPVIHFTDLADAYAEVKQIEMPKDIFLALRQLREDMVGAQIYVSERRWMDCLPILKAQAWLVGNSAVEKDDIRWLQHVLWSDEAHIKTVQRLVLNLANPLDKECLSLSDDIENLRRQFKNAKADKGDAVTEKSFIKTTVEVVGKLRRVRAKLNGVRNELEAQELKSVEFARTEKKLKDLTTEAAKALGVDEETMKLSAD